MDDTIIQSALGQGGKNAQYTIIHVVETAVARYAGAGAMDMETRADERNLKSYQTQLKKLGYNSDIEIGYGNVAKAIAKVVDQHNIDLLVMGAHGHKGISDIVLGTSVDAVRHRINVPLLIVK